MTSEDDTGNGDLRESPPNAAAARAARIAAASLCVLVDGGTDAAAFSRLVVPLIRVGVPLLQVRDKRLPAAELTSRVRRALEIARAEHPGRPPLIIVNDRVDVAVATGADGGHVGAGDLPTAEARRLLGPRGILGRTAHSVAEARQAMADGADYLGIGPCFPSATKAFQAFASEDFLRGVTASIPVPAFAIGGVTLETIDSLAALGVRRVAVASAVTAARDPAAAARDLLDRLAALGRER